MSKHSQFNFVEDIKLSFIKALKRLLIPLVRLLIKQHISYQEAAKALKEVYIDVANTNFQQKNDKKNSKTYISHLTGINRKEISSIIKDLECHRSIKSNSHSDLTFNLSELLAKWHLDKNYSESPSYPSAIPLEGKNSFAQLLKECNIDGSAEEWTNDLIENGNISLLTNGLVIPRRPSYYLANSHKNRIANFGDIVHALIANLENNYEAMLNSRDDDYMLNARVYTKHTISEEVHDKFKQLIRKRGVKFLELLNSILLEGKDTDQAKISSDNEIGLCMFYYDIQQGSKL